VLFVVFRIFFVDFDFLFEERAAERPVACTTREPSSCSSHQSSWKKEVVRLVVAEL